MIQLERRIHCRTMLLNPGKTMEFTALFLAVTIVMWSPGEDRDRSRWSCSL
jgi:hypothetical protein